MSEVLQKQRLVAEDTLADGNCLYHAISSQLRRVGQEKTYQNLRNLACDTLEDHPAIVHVFEQMSNQPQDPEPWTLELAREDGSWGNVGCIIALARALCRDICVISREAGRWRCNRFDGQYSEVRGRKIRNFPVETPLRYLSMENNELVIAHVGGNHFVGVVSKGM